MMMLAFQVLWGGLEIGGVGLSSLGKGGVSRQIFNVGRTPKNVVGQDTSS